MRGHLLKLVTPQQRSGDSFTLVHPEGPDIQIHERLRQEPNSFEEFGEWIEDAALHNQ